MVAMAIGPGDDRRFYVYVLKHNDTPIWVGLGSGSRHEIRRHCTDTATPVAKRERRIESGDGSLFNLLHNSFDSIVDTISGTVSLSRFDSMTDKMIKMIKKRAALKAAAKTK